MRSLFLAACAALTLFSTVPAEAKPKASAQTSDICGQPDIKKMMGDALRGASADDLNRPIASYGVDLSRIVSSKTISASKNIVMCKVVIDVRYGGQSMTMRGQIQLKILPKNFVQLTLQPFY